jgi:DNA-binding MurR/RpiR family transcriptional regulator
MAQGKQDGGCCERECVARAREVLVTEAQAVQALAERLDDSFCQAVSLVLNAAGRTVVTGVGKSARLPAPARRRCSCTRRRACTATWGW